MYRVREATHDVWVLDNLGDEFTAGDEVAGYLVEVGGGITLHLSRLTQGLLLQVTWRHGYNTGPHHTNQHGETVTLQGLVTCNQYGDRVIIITQGPVTWLYITAHLAQYVQSQHYEFSFLSLSTLYTIKVEM